MDDQQQDKVAHFSAITGANPSSAQAALEATNWDLEQAAGLYLAAQENDPNADADEQFGADEPANQPTSSSAQSASQGVSSSSSRKPPGQKPKAMTLRDLQRGGDEEDDEDDDKPRDLFAGGEKSGLAVQDPDNAGGPVDHFRNIMNQARHNRPRPGGEDEDEAQQPQSTAFSGRAQTLGGDDAPSQIVEDASAGRRQQSQRLPRVTRTLHLWSDGISIDDGPLFRFDDPNNQHIMAQVNQGRAPLSLLDVQPDQEVDLNLVPHKDEKYVQPPKKYKPFGGSGQRLGSPTPGAGSSTTSAATPAAASYPATSQASTSNQPAQMAVDDSQPTLRIQIRLGDGSRLQSRFNTSHTIGDVYDFVNSASAASNQRPYVLITTFPNKEYSDKGVVLGELEEFKRGGGSLMQKWT